MKESRKKLVLFGAGKIGRSFIGQIFNRSGYEVVFLDINQDLIRRPARIACSTSIDCQVAS
ncbi:MAG: hypothetical protein JW830_01125 [Bacteroidales bacterium]|nr:hypothetical protein [Bacteroidales bacterium]